MTLDFSKMNGLLPAVIQDEASGQILMLGYMSEDALAKTLESGLITFFSRSKNRLWTKGESSGNRLRLKSWACDCDEDTLLFQVEAEGPTCHTGSLSCFKTPKPQRNFLEELESTIDSRKRGSFAKSYTVELFESGVKRIAQKIGEEGVETALALATGDKAELIDEAADLLFHLLVGLSSQGLGFKDVINRLEDRHRP